jgi:hypothetical protein
MGHFHIQRKRNKKNRKTIQGHANENSIWKLNTIRNLRRHLRTNKYNKSGIYQIKCLVCPLKHIGKSGRIFHTIFKEYIQAVRNNNSNSGYSSGALNTGHIYGAVTDTMDIIRTHKKGRKLNILEKYHIYKISKNRLHVNDTNIDTHNPIFRILQEINIS